MSFCSNDWRFLKQCVQGITAFCDEILITVCDHFFDGSQENYALLERAYSSFPKCTFLEFAFDPVRSFHYFSSLFPEHSNWRHAWHNVGRWLGFLYASPQTEYLLFLDCDEIVESDNFIHWLKQFDIHNYVVCRFAGTWHFRKACFVATTQADLSLLVRKSALCGSILWDEDERSGIYERIKGRKIKNIQSVNGAPLIHHYSGVRTKKEMLKKFATWGHHWERNWADLVKREFSASFSGVDFIRGYRYLKTKVDFDPLLEKIPRVKAISLEEHCQNLTKFCNVKKIDRQDAFRNEIEHDFLHHH